MVYNHEIELLESFCPTPSPIQIAGDPLQLLSFPACYRIHPRIRHCISGQISS